MKRGAMLLILLAGCGEAAPTIMDARVSSPLVQRGREFFVTLIGVEDVDGDVYRGHVNVEMKSKEDGDVKLRNQVTPSESYEATRGDVIFGIRLLGAAPTGAYEVKSVFVDQSGNESEPKVLEVTVTR